MDKSLMSLGLSHSLQTPSSGIKRSMFGTDWSPHVSCIFPTHQRTASVQRTPYSHWISASLSLSLSLSPFLSTILPCVAAFPLPDSHHSSASSPPSLFRARGLRSIPSCLSSSHSSLLTSISLNLSFPPVNRVTLQPAVASLPPRLCHLSLSLRLLWVNMTHASIILLSFCHYYALWTTLHLSLAPSPHSFTPSLSLLSLGPSYSPLLISAVMTNTSITLQSSLK